MEKKHFDEVDICKGIAMLTVLWHHSFIKYPVNLLDIPWCNYAMTINGTYFMVVFFMISGYLFAHSHKRTFLENLKNKSQRLLLPYLTYEFINLSVKLLFPSLVNRKVGGEYIENMLLRGGELWFVYVLFLIFVIWSWVIHKMNKTAIITTIVILAVASQVIPGDFNNEIFLYPRVLFYSIFFLLGYLLKDINRQWLLNKRLFFHSGLLFLIFNCILVMRIDIPYIWGYVLNFIGCWFVWSLSFQIVSNKVLTKLLSFVGKYSLSFYWLNGFVLVLARTLIVKGLHIENTILIVISIFMLCVVIETVAIIMLKRIPYVRTIVGL